jgi:Fur family ferric uptake transcriptional regulator
MCHRCDYSDLLKACQLGVSANRLCVLEVIGNTNAPPSAGDIFKTLERTTSINRVTVYEYHPAHSHFYCKSCGHMECLNPQSLNVDTQPMQRTFAGLIENVEVRVDGVCKTCLQTENGNAH